jgi:uncharacterized protein (DUF433 family)
MRLACRCPETADEVLQPRHSVIKIERGWRPGRFGRNIMTIHEDWEQVLSTMSRAEKAQLLQWIVRDLGDSFPGIESNPHVCGGEACIVRTRIPVWLLVRARNLGLSEADILRSYPTLRAEDLANAWGYYRAHRDDIDNEIRENEAS